MLASAEIRDGVDDVFTACCTMPVDGTVRALGMPGGADEGAKFHEGLVYESWAGVGFKIFCGDHVRERKFPELLLDWALLNILADAMHAGEEARNVAIEDWVRLIECDAADGAGCVPPDSWQAQEELMIFGEAARILFDDDLRCSMEVFCAGIIPETFPAFENVIERRLRHTGHARKSIHPPAPVWQHRTYLRLLQHNFRDPDSVDIGLATPW